MNKNDPVIVESTVTISNPKYRAEDTGGFLPYAIGTSLAGFMALAGADIGNQLYLYSGIVSMASFFGFGCLRFVLIASMVSTRTETEYYESLDNPPDDNLNLPDKPKPEPAPYRLFDQWGVDVDKFGRHLFNEVTEGKQITRDELAEAVKRYEAKTGKNLKLNLTRRWKIGEAQKALKQVGFVDSIAEGEARYMLPAQKLLDYRLKA